MGATRYDRDDDPDRDINTLVWHKRPVERLESGPKGEDARYGYQRLDTGEIHYTTRRGVMDDEVGAPPTPIESNPIWLRPHPGISAPQGKVSRAKSELFDKSIPRCNCTATHLADLKAGQGAKLDYRRSCPVHHHDGDPGPSTGESHLPEDEHGCNCESMYRLDIKHKQDGLFQPHRRCRVHGPYHAPMTDQDEKEEEEAGSWRRLLRSAARRFNGEADDSSDDDDDDDYDDEKIHHIHPRTTTTFLDEKMSAATMNSPIPPKVRRSQSTRNANPTPMVSTKAITDSHRSPRHARSMSNGAMASSRHGTIPIVFEGNPANNNNTVTKNTAVHNNANSHPSSPHPPVQRSKSVRVAAPRRVSMEHPPPLPHDPSDSIKFMRGAPAENIKPTDATTSLRRARTESIKLPQRAPTEGVHSHPQRSTEGIPIRSLSRKGHRHPTNSPQNVPTMPMSLPAVGALSQQQWPAAVTGHRHDAYAPSLPPPSFSKASNHRRMDMHPPEPLV